MGTSHIHLKVCFISLIYGNTEYIFRYIKCMNISDIVERALIKHYGAIMNASKNSFTQFQLSFQWSFNFHLLS